LFQSKTRADKTPSNPHTKRPPSRPDSRLPLVSLKRGLEGQPSSSGSIATSRAAGRHNSAGVGCEPSSSKMRTSFRSRPSSTRTCSRAALALSGRSTTSVTPTPEVTVNRIAWERPSLWPNGRSQTHINETSFQPPQARRVMISRIKRLKVNSSRPGCAVGGKSKPSSYSRAASVEDCDTLSTPEVCDALSKREVLIAV
jgi:hypothetical protein